MSSCRVLEWWCHLSSVDNISKWFELPCASVFAFCNFLSAIARCAKFYEILSKLFQFWEKVFCPQPSIRPLISVGKVALAVENWNGSWLQNNGGDFSLSKKLISHYCQKSLISHCQKHLICGQICDSRGSGYRCFELGDIGVKVVVCLRITTLQRQPATAGGKEGGQGWSKGGKGEIVVDKRGLVRYVDLNGGKTGGLVIVCTDLKFEDSENYLLIKVWRQNYGRKKFSTLVKKYFFFLLVELSGRGCCWCWSENANES